ncbi:glycosyl hydrolase [Coraliomargarita sp. SDUM461004]|uniref:Glycosyl hydrolase n=1 Tax=Thalassobacterium sedimentorum TaxID=3041258 RepID=A0ABU1AQ34_9BACT|nr:glycosyl hydrolase [Coraliomargarita sp. SDUM461004]MDQ8195970.1 glycosyl hydrolase [Coraliomargarita sp. SDUM461004]
MKIENNDKLFQQWLNPSVQFRGKPFWSWNGKLEKEELLYQIDVMKEMGMGGFFMHSRTGLETEYLGEEWFELINACADYADEIGLEAWIYDEDRWPSGLAGGIVSKHPEYRQKAILLEIDPEGEGSNVIAEYQCDLDGAVCTNLGSGKQKIRFSVIEQGKCGFYNGYTYIDTMNRGATEAFLQCTHEKYAQKCGDRLGKSIKGIFTDEPHRGALLDGFSMYMENGEMTAPYTQKLFEEFEARFGYDLKPKLPELFLQVDGKRISPVKWHFVELLQQLFLENYAMPCQKWCEAHNLVLTGHVLHEDNLTVQTAMSGSVMRYYEHMTAPGIDILGEENLCYWVVKQLSSATRQTGQTQLLSELYGCTGWQMPFAGHKAVGDWQTLLGINFRCQHLSWYTMRGEAKRDYPASILHQSPWYKDYGHVEDYFARFGLIMTQGEPVCDLLVINPVESLWAQVHLGWSKALNLQDEHLKTLEVNYQTLFTWLLESQVDFDYGDEAMLAQMGKVDEGRLQVGCAKYKTVLISGVETIRSSTLELLDQFVAAGGHVVIAGSAPTHVDALESSRFNPESSKFQTVPFTKPSVLAAVPTALATVDAPDVFGQLRKVNGGLVFAALNVDRSERRKSVTVRIQTELPIVEWDCVSGEVLSVITKREGDWQVFETDFPVGGQKLWVANAESQQVDRPALGLLEDEKFTISLNHSFDYMLSEPNVCVLDFAAYQMDGGEWQNEAEVLKVDQQIRDAHGIMRRGGQMLQPWFVAQNPVKELCDLALRYTFEVETLPEWIDLVIEEPENFTVELNGKPIGLSDSKRWIDIAFHRIRIPEGRLQLGSNEIILKTRYTENSNVEAVYLLGEFGVKLNGIQRTIVPIATKLEVGDLCEQGFPFYSGAVTYQLPLPKAANRIRLPEVSGACVKVNGQVIGWDPFEADVSGTSVDVEVILTRRNTFGPLHDAVEKRPRNWPQNWITEGEEFEENPVLHPSGLLAAPMIQCI